MTKLAKPQKSGSDHQLAINRLLNGHRIFRGFAKTAAHILVSILYRVSYEGVENIPSQGPVLLVSNHTSMIDVPAIHVRFKPWLYWVAKKEWFTTSFIGPFFSAMGCIPVDRHKVDLTAARGIIGALEAGQIVAIFPQGSRVGPERVLEHPPRTGVAHFAIKTQAPMVPVLIDGNFKLGRRVRVSFGPSFKLDANPRQRYDHAQLMEFTISIMQKIYDMKNLDYHLSDQSLMEEHLMRLPDGRLTLMSSGEQDAVNILKQQGQ